MALLLGATVLGWLWPSAQSWIFPTDGSTPVILGAIYQLGLLLLLFIAGSELRTVFHRGERRTVAMVFAAGMCLPFIAGLGISQVIDQKSLWGPSGNTTSFVLVFSIALAITSIPVISRIMHDIGILDTAFARVVLGVAVLEDLVLYVVLAVAIGYAGGVGSTLFGLPSALGITGGSNQDLIYHVLMTLAFLAVFLVAGPPAYRWIGNLEMNVIQRATPIAHQLTFMILATAAALMLGLEAFFGAFVAGIVVAATETKPSQATLAIRSFSLAFFIPVYFAGIGLGLDLIHQLRRCLLRLVPARRLPDQGRKRVRRRPRSRRGQLQLAKPVRGDERARRAGDRGRVDRVCRRDHRLQLLRRVGAACDPHVARRRSLARARPAPQAAHPTGGSD